ncbi:uncharacterized protein LOC123662449 [Melitaea cinxia]|uniref:uncharacterized protein LOC123662449 n=1 Tax=Melitaea cinxia TaxID=113334 RepID=UPI001E2717E7|nr:uncharacterized protein LOC123662449 [Melitaea cinxia]
MQRSPPQTTSQQIKFSSNPDLAESLRGNENANVNFRKRKQNYDDNQDAMLEIIEKKIDEKLNAWKSELDTSIATTIKNSMQIIIEQEMEKISLSFNKIFKHVNDRLDTIETSLCFATDRQDSFDARLTEAEIKFKENTGISSQISELQYKMDSMEQQARLYNVEITNLPERRDENLIAILEKIGSVIKYPIDTSSIVSIHRVPHFDKKNSKPKNIIVRFTTKILRNNFITAAKLAGALKSDQLSISGTVQNIFINEHLTVKNKQLFRMCREAAAKHKYKYVWIKNGTILVRQTDSSAIFAVRNEHDVKKIK